MRMPRSRRPTRSQRAYVLVYLVALVALGIGLDSLGVGPLPTRSYAVAIWLVIMSAMLVRQIPPAQFGRRPITAQAQEVRREMVSALAIAVVGAPIVYLLGELSGAGWFQVAVQVAFIVFVLALIGYRVARHGQSKS